MTSNPILFANPFLVAVSPITSGGSKKKKVTKTKIDITEFKKLSKALLIMIVDGSTKMLPRFRAKNEILEVSFRGSRSKDAQNLYTVKRLSKRALKSTVGTEFYATNRCDSLALVIRSKYPRICDIADKDRATKLHVVEVTEEAILWAETVAKEAGTDMAKDFVITGEEVTRRPVQRSLSGAVDRQKAIENFSKPRKKVPANTSIKIENIEVKEI